MQQSILLGQRPDINLPWCSNCRCHSDYKNILEQVTRMNPDDGTYTDTTEVPRCLKCNGTMHEIRDYRTIVYIVNIMLSIFWIVLFACSIYLYPMSGYFWSVLLAYSSLTFAIWLAPTRARRRYRDWRNWAEEQKELTSIN